MVLPHDPAPILAHDGQTVQNHCLAGADDHPGLPLIELPREFKVDVFVFRFHSFVLPNLPNFTATSKRRARSTTEAPTLWLFLRQRVRLRCSSSSRKGAQ